MQQQRNLLSRALDRLRHDGLASVAGRFVRKFIYRRWTLIWMERSLAVPMTVPPRLRELRIIHIQASDLDSLDPFFANRREDLAALLKMGARGWGVVKPDGRIIAFAWVMAKDYQDDIYYHCLFPVQAGEVFQFSAEVAEQNRGGPAALELVRAIWSDSAAQGYEKWMTVVDAENIPSLRINLHLGVNEAMRLTHVSRWFGWFYSSRMETYSEPRLDHLRKKPKVTAA